MTFEEKWDELKHTINCSINYNEKMMETLSEDVKKYVDMKYESYARDKVNLLVKHWHNVQELKCVQAMMEDIERMDEDDE